VSRRPVDELLNAFRAALDHGDRQHLLALLAGCEGAWFLDGWTCAAGELGCARLELERGDDRRAVGILERLADEPRMR
jgi:hypothetical protein